MHARVFFLLKFPLFYAGLRCPLGRIVAWHQSGCEPQVMGLGPIDSVKGLMEKLSWSVDDVDLFELNEAFAAQSLAVCRQPVPLCAASHATTLLHHLI